MIHYTDVIPTHVIQIQNRHLKVINVIHIFDNFLIRKSHLTKSVLRQGITFEGTMRLYRIKPVTLTLSLCSSISTAFFILPATFHHYSKKNIKFTHNNNNNNNNNNKIPSSNKNENLVFSHTDNNSDVIMEDNIKISQRAQSVESFKVMDVLCRANELQLEGKTIYHCEVGQPESGAPQTVAQAALTALQGKKEVMGYTDAFGLLDLRKNIANHYVQKYPSFPKDRIDVKQIVVTTGSSGGFLLTFTACFDPNDIVAVASSGYPCYRNILSALGCQIATIPINKEFKLTSKELSNEIERRKQMSLPPLSGLILSSPSNPTGSMLTPKELKDLCELCDQEGIQFISDEIYHGISYGSVEEATALQYSDKVIVINSFSKYYSSKFFAILCFNILLLTW